jgi:DNA excision repair protein ERCC-6-like 2
LTDLIFRLASRHKALIQLGMINSPSDVPAFARDLRVFFLFFLSFQFINPRYYAFVSARQSEEAQRKILAELDRWAEMQVDSGDSDSSSD